LCYDASFQGETGSLWHTERLERMVGNNLKKEIIPQSTHMEFYHGEKYIDLAVNKLTEFFNKHL
jgi:hypothetical protein